MRQSRGEVAASLSLALTMSVLALCGLVLGAPTSHAAPVPTTLVFSTSGARSAPVSLDAASVSGSIFPFTTPDSATTTRVRFYLDDPGGANAAYHTENTAPYDLAGGSTTVANPFATTALIDGAHTLTAVVVDSGGAQQVVTAAFTVANSVPPPPGAPQQIHLAWNGDAATTFTVLWVTSSPSTPATLRYRTRPTDPWTSTTGQLKLSGSTSSLRQATAIGLSPDTTYDYQVLGDGGVWSSVLSTRTVGVASAYTFVYEADTGVAGRLDGLAAGTTGVLNEIRSLDPGLILGGGDYVSFDTDTRYPNVNAAIDAWFQQEQPLASRAPLMPTYGNHEVLLGEGFVPWADRFTTPTGVMGEDNTAGDKRGNYSFDVGPVHYISLESVTETSPEPAAVMTWLEADIVAARARAVPWIVPFMHAGAITDGASHAVNFALQAQLGPLFERLGVPLVLSSHDQAFERSYPLIGLRDTRVTAPTIASSNLTCYQDTGNGVVYLKVSPSGKLSNQNRGFSVFKSATKPAWTAVRNNTAHHITVGQVTAMALTMTTYDIDNAGVATVADQFTIRKSPCGAGLAFAPAAATVTVTAGATATTTASLAATPATPFSLSSSAPWLSASASGASTPAAVTLAVDAGGLLPGSYSGTVTATATDGTTATESVTLTVTAAPIPTTLRVSTHSDRSASVALAGAVATGAIYVYSTPVRATTTKILFYLDDPGRTKAAFHQENTAPYDLAGGTTTVASPFQSGSLTNGSHTVTAVVFDSVAVPEVVTAGFAVAN